MAEAHARDVEPIRLRLAYAGAGGNLAGAVAVFLFAGLALPVPAGVHHQVRVLLLNAGVFVIAMSVAMAVGWRTSRGAWLRALEWLQAEREPTEHELQLTLRFPLTQQKINAGLWLIGAILFTAVNLPFSAGGALATGLAIILGGNVTVAVGYLATERLMRPITARALAAHTPERPQLPGVGTRTVLVWMLGTGVILDTLWLVGVAALVQPHGFTRVRLVVLILLLSSAGLVVGLAMMRAFAHSLAEPIGALREAFARVERGDLEHGVTVDDGSEIGLLQAGFNRMLWGLREREQIRDLFGRQVGEDVVRQALERGVELGGEARDAAVLFVDLKGSTAFAAERDPAEVVEVLNRFFAVVVDVVAAHHGWVNKFEGDAALCAFGVPLEDPAAADHALCAARILRDRLTAEVRELRAGIGVSAGRVVAGNIGAASRFEYTVIGDPVNEAARLSELAKHHPELVLASDAALSRADPRETARWRDGEQLVLRGRERPTSVATPA